MIKIKTLGAAAVGALAFAGFVAILGAQAQTASLAVTCSGNVSSNMVTWTAAATGGNAPYAFVWTGDTLGGKTGTSASATYSSNGTRTVGVQVTDASSTLATSTCAATITSFGGTTTSTPPLPRVREPMLTITPGGNFLARGMTVTSVSSGSFQGQVWGITYTVNWVKTFSPEFFLRLGDKSTSTPDRQLVVGDEVGVAGKVTADAPFVVNGTVIRDYSILKIRHHDGENGDNNGNNGNGNHENGNSTGTPVNASSDTEIRIQGLLEKLKGLQGLFNSGKGNSGDSGSSSGNGSNHSGGNGY